MRYYPIFLDLRGRRCVVVGGGKVAERKVQSLLRAGASVQVISPELTPRLAQLAARNRITVTARAYRNGDVRAQTRESRKQVPLLVFAATDDPRTQQMVRQDAGAVGALVNVADDPRDSAFLVPASFAQGDLQVALSTSGGSPALARKLRQQLQITLGREYATYLRFLREARWQIRQSISSQERRARVFRQVAGRMPDWFRKGGRQRAEAELSRLLRKTSVNPRQSKQQAIKTPDTGFEKER